MRVNWSSSALPAEKTARHPKPPDIDPKGWVAAGLLQEGDEVVKYIAGEPAPLGTDPDYVQVPTPIEDVTGSPGEPFGMATISVPVTAEHFHGDGVDGDVCVIRPIASGELS